MSDELQIQKDILLGIEKNGEYLRLILEQLEKFEPRISALEEYMRAEMVIDELL